MMIIEMVLRQVGKDAYIKLTLINPRQIKCMGLHFHHHMSHSRGNHVPEYFLKIH